MQRAAVTAPISSATSVAQLTELAKAADVSLTEEEKEKLDLASAYS
jgi:aryl-alcohol dehydrogenase-like predicted oxidoreductase